MRIARFGIVALGFAVGLCTLMAWWLLIPPPVRLPRHEPRPASIETVKSDLCRVGRSERKYFSATGHYANRYELPSNGDFAVPRQRWPYFYQISVPVPDRFVVEAIPVRSVNRRLTVLSLDHSLRVCVLSPNMPDAGGKLDELPRTWNDAEPDYGCEPCPAEK